jgi:septum formation protein
VKPILLASASATRARLLAAACVDFEVAVSGVDEGTLKARWIVEGHTPRRIAGGLAKAKALAVAAHRSAVVVGADQTLEFEGRQFDKTTSLDETRSLLMRLRGQVFHLHAGVAVAEEGAVIWEETHSARLTMRPFTDAFLDGYLARNGDRLASSLGGFELEAEGAQLFDEIEGDVFAILGLPMLPLLKALRRAGALAQ